jgi:drug/metabolite transporter (DMT)-like permease
MKNESDAEPAPVWRYRQLLLNVVVLLSIVVLWVTTGEVFRVAGKRLSYSKPYFMLMCYLGVTALILPVLLLSMCFDTPWRRLRTVLADENMSVARFVAWVLTCSSFCIGMNYCYYVALRWTSVASTVAIANLAAAPIFLVSVKLFGEKWEDPSRWIKSGGILVCVAGSILVVVGDEKLHASSWLGDLLAFVSMLMLSLWILGIRWFQGETRSVILSLYYVGFGGLASVVLASWPLLPLNYSGFEPFQFPVSADDWAAFAITVMSLVILMLVNTLAVPFCSPLYLAVANFVVLPVSAACDAILDRFFYNGVSEFNAVKIAGLCCIASGFVVVEIVPFVVDWLRERAAGRKGGYQTIQNN